MIKAEREPRDFEMTVWNEVPFEELLIESRDGEWGLGEPTVGHQLCEVIRGTDFAGLHSAGIELPKRWIPDHIVDRKKLRAGDIVLETAGGTAKQSTGRSALLTNTFFEKHKDFPVLCASFSRHLRLDTKKFDSGFIYYLLQALHSAGYMAVYHLQHTGVARFQYTSFKKKTVLKIPDKHIQRKFSATLSTYDDLIENNRRRIELLEQMAEELYREWFVRFRFPGYQQAKFEKGMPVGWKQIGLGSLGSYLNGYAFKPSDLSLDGIPVIKIKEINGGVTTETPRNSGSSIAKKYHFDDGAIIFSWSATLAVKVWDQGPGLLNQHLFKVAPAEGIPSSFLYLSIKFCLPIFDSLTTGSTMKHIKRKELDAVKVGLPDKAILDEFDRSASPLLQEKLKLSKANQLLVEARNQLLTRLISGKLPIDQLDIQFPPSMREADAARQEVAHA